MSRHSANEKVIRVHLFPNERQVFSVSPSDGRDAWKSYDRDIPICLLERYERAWKELEEVEEELERIWREKKQ